MAKYILKRLFWAAVTLFVIMFILFLLLEFMPGSPFNDEKLSSDQLEVLRAHYGLDKPFFEKFWIFLKNGVQGNFGNSYSISTNVEVSKIILPRLGVSVRIGLQALLLGSVVGVILGLISGSNQNTWKDTTSTIVSVIGVSIPSFVFALLLAYFIGFKLKLFPITYNINKPFSSSVLSTIALSMFTLAQVTRFLRTELVEVMGSEYIRLARTKGVPRTKLLFKHGFRNALISVVTIIGPLTVNLLTGSLAVEKLFSIPGVGRLLVDSISRRDFNVTIMIAFIYSAMYITVNLVVDILYGIIDPRIRVGKGG